MNAKHEIKLTNKFTLIDRSLLKKSAQIIAITLIFFIPISNLLVSILSFLLLLSWLLSNTKDELKQLWRHPLTKFTAFFVLLWIFGALYSSGSKEFILQDIRKYSRLLFIPIYISLFKDNFWTQRAFYAFWGAMAISLFVIAAKLTNYIDPNLFYPRSTEAFKDYIYTNMFMSLFIFTIAHYFSHKKNQYWWLVPTTVFVTYYILFISPGRTGQIIFLLLSCLFIFQRLPKKYMYLPVLVLGIMIATAWYLPSSFKDRMSESIHNTIHYQENKAIKKETSVGLRFEFYTNSWEIFKMKPWFGWGTGSFPETYAREALDVNSGLLTTNPHNQYLHIMVSLGVIGLIAYLSLMGAAFNCCFHVPTRNKHILQGVILTFFIGCLANSWLMDYASMMLFVSFIGIMSANYKEEAYSSKC